MTENKVKNVIMPEEWFNVLPRRQYSFFIRTESADSWFSVYRIKPDIYAIYEDGHFQEVISYLITGTESALLLDTGLGIGDIKKVVESLYQGKIQVTHTHSHFDHIGGDWQFEEVYVPDHPVAVNRARRGLDHEEVKDNMEAGSNWKPYPVGFDSNSYLIRPAKSFQTVKEGFVFDLGNIKLEVLETPGHSPDSLMYADHENKILFTGDTFYPATLYAHIEHSDGSDSSFETYRKTMHRIAEQYSDYTLITSHNEPLRPGIELLKVAEAFDEIDEGSLTYITDDKGLKKYEFEDFAIVTK